ncbi:MAG: hypothetical protein LBI82_09450 [Dysgonamonadaceae bacterium]|jgi:hypothetical protein|nr:hypothetical protein [Dysgonamonadaceae bacterium]
MPYRRLPNTDAARIKSLKCALEQDLQLPFPNRMISVELMETAGVFLSSFEGARAEYDRAYTAQINTSKSFQELTKNAKLYISHFIQVLNLSVVRKEINSELKSLYGLDPNSQQVPELFSDALVLEWGEKIIQGEKARMTKGGTPLYNPTIAKVQVHYEMFKTAYHQQKVLQKNTARALSKLSSLRIKADEIICNIWNQIESKYADAEIKSRLDNCKKYGVVYYYRRGEKICD